MYATSPVVKSKTGLENTDDAAWQIHATEKAAMAAVRAGLLCGDKFVAVFKLQGLFKVKDLQIEEEK